MQMTTCDGGTSVQPNIIKGGGEKEVEKEHSEKQELGLLPEEAKLSSQAR